jgi:hypothetical protein
VAFDTVEFAEDDELYNFKSLLNDERPRRAQPSSPSSTSTGSSEPTSLNVPLLKRGRSVRVDQFLDSLVGYPFWKTLELLSVLTSSFVRKRHSRHCTEERYMPYVSRSWVTLRLGQILSNSGRSVSSTNSPLKANVKCKVWRLILETRTYMIQALIYMVLSSTCFERCMTNAESYHSCQVRRLLTSSSCGCLTNSTSKMTATSSPAYCTSKTDGSQKAM